MPVCKIAVGVMLCDVLGSQIQRKISILKQSLAM